MSRKHVSPLEFAIRTARAREAQGRERVSVLPPRGGLAFRLLICNACRAVWPTERDEAHGGSRLDGDPCAYRWDDGRVCDGYVWPMFDPDDTRRAPPPFAGAVWYEGDGRWRKELGLEGVEGVTLAHARAAYRRLSKERHPDQGGTHEQMLALNKAWSQALAELGQPGDP